MKPLLKTLASALFLLTLLSITAWGKNPTLQPVPGSTFPSEVQPGHTYSASMTYQEPEGDPPAALNLILETPGGNVTVHAPKPSGDATQGIPVTWTYTPENSGTYKYHFESTSSTGGSVRYPESPADDPQFVSVNLVTKYIILAIGFLVALVFLPFVVYVASRSVNRRGDPGAAARIAVLIGVLASYGLFIYLFFTVYGFLGTGIGAVAALAILIALFSRRRAV